MVDVFEQVFGFHKSRAFNLNRVRRNGGSMDGSNGILNFADNIPVICKWKENASFEYNVVEDNIFRLKCNF